MPRKPRPTYKEITAKYPNLFKDFPDLREAMGREREYTELFDTVDAAKEAKEQVEDFSYLRELVESGSPDKTEEFLAAVKEGGEENLINFAGSFLPALHRAAPDTYIQVTSAISSRILS